MYRTAESMAEEDGEERNLLWGADPSPLPPATHTWNGTLDASRGVRSARESIEGFRVGSVGVGTEEEDLTEKAEELGSLNNGGGGSRPFSSATGGIDGTRGAAVPTPRGSPPNGTILILKTFLPSLGINFSKKRGNTGDNVFRPVHMVNPFLSFLLRSTWFLFPYSYLFNLRIRVL